MRLIKRHEENGPRVDVGPMFRARPFAAPTAAMVEASELAERLPTRDYIGEEPGDLAPKDPNAEAQQWAHERELYEEKDAGSGSAA